MKAEVATGMQVDIETCLCLEEFDRGSSEMEFPLVLEEAALNPICSTIKESNFIAVAREENQGINKIVYAKPLKF